MKKKKMQLDRKLFLHKSTIAALNKEQQLLLEGGVDRPTRPPLCGTINNTCPTRPVGQVACRPCFEPTEP
ncbi:class I lanthipeptide [Chitinophaga nivalis]|uniref:Class I lanthipeptide n=1 Tax=Chitinophaga nivalis TaxID=2991709 RepID=A0ABT3ILF8_9BACT|nr:class I lanthipeptide [Chitinophaga nivalis]MCW3465563.1 class I lanthipeptide [Chitinophaga nivalis]MCW3484746.1 class I lanthipeptide [Chitinophaga nivalis]